MLLEASTSLQIDYSIKRKKEKKNDKPKTQLIWVMKINCSQLKSLI